MSEKIVKFKYLLAALSEAPSQKLFECILKSSPLDFLAALKEIFVNISELNIDIESENLDVLTRGAEKVEEIIDNPRLGCLRHQKIARLGIKVALEHLRIL